MKRIFIITLSLGMCGAQLHGAAEEAMPSLVSWKYTRETQKAANHLYRWAKFAGQDNCYGDMRWHLSQAMQPGINYNEVTASLEDDLGCVTRSIAVTRNDFLWKQQLSNLSLTYATAIERAKQLAARPAVEPQD